ncbi:MAG: SGNH/GDSL hydrolase family protein, partial [Leptospiraceae bacterium]|nr:SGNH/GDSL hydrolase family protein [Leptospiraceae bacterium]
MKTKLQTFILFLSSPVSLFFIHTPAFAQPPILPGEDCVIVCPPDPRYACACIPTGPGTPPSPDVGSDPAFSIPGHLSIPAFDPNSTVPLNSISASAPDPAAIRFTMLGDSRTNWVPGYPPWRDLLDAFKNPACGPHTNFDNFGAPGSTTGDWLTCMQNRLSDICKLENMTNRVVIMLGGNDVIRRAGAWSHIPWNTWRTEVKNQQLNEIHARFKTIVLLLRAAGKEVIVQNHFGPKPGSNDPYWLAVNEGMQGLRARLYNEYVPGVHLISGGKVECSEYYRLCYTYRKDKSYQCRIFGWCNHKKVCVNT